MSMIQNDEMIEEVLDNVVDDMGIDYLQKRVPPLKKIDEQFKKK